MFVDGFRIAQALAGGGSCKEDDPGEVTLRRDILAQIFGCGGRWVLFKKGKLG